MKIIAPVAALTLLAATWLPACGEDTDALDCEEVAIRTAEGEVDECDLQACQACEEACEVGCLILESYPPQYSCEGEGTWDVYDFCPDWSMDTGL